METETDLNKDGGKHTDEGYSERRLALKVDKGIPSKPTTQGGNVFTGTPSSQHTVFQAQKKKEI